MRFVLALLSLLLVSSAGAQDSTQAGRFTVEHPTLHNLGFEWAISGDANRNASVSVEFRRVGESAWREALPMVRVGGERMLEIPPAMAYGAEGVPGLIPPDATLLYEIELVSIGPHAE